MNCFLRYLLGCFFLRRQFCTVPCTTVLCSSPLASPQLQHLVIHAEALKPPYTPGTLCRLCRGWHCNNDICHHLGNRASHTSVCRESNPYPFLLSKPFHGRSSCRSAEAELHGKCHVYPLTSVLTIPGNVLPWLEAPCSLWLRASLYTN